MQGAQEITDCVHKRLQKVHKRYTGCIREHRKYTRLGLHKGLQAMQIKLQSIAVCLFFWTGEGGGGGGSGSKESIL